MSLTPQEEREMYSDIKVIKNSCVGCQKKIDDHEKRIGILEKGFWVFTGVVSFIMLFLKG